MDSRLSTFRYRKTIGCSVVGSIVGGGRVGGGIVGGGGGGGGFDLADGRIGSRESILRPLSHQTGLCPITQHPPLSGPSQYILDQIYCPAFILGKLKNYVFPQPSGW